MSLNVFENWGGGKEGETRQSRTQRAARKQGRRTLKSWYSLMPQGAYAGCFHRTSYSSGLNGVDELRWLGGRARRVGRGSNERQQGRHCREARDLASEIGATRERGRGSDAPLERDKVAHRADGKVEHDVHVAPVHLVDQVAPVVERAPVGVGEREVDRRVRVGLPRHVDLRGGRVGTGIVSDHALKA